MADVWNTDDAAADNPELESLVTSAALRIPALSFTPDLIDNAVSSARIGVFLADLRKREFRCNRTTLDAFGVEALESVQLGHLLSTVTPGERLPLIQQVRESIAEHSRLDTEITVVHPDGSQHALRLRAGFTSRDSDVLAGTAIEVTGENRERQDLLRSRQLLATLVKNAPVAIAMLDRNLCYICASDRHLRDIGMEGRSVEGQHFYEVFPHYLPRWTTAHQRGLAGEKLSGEDTWVDPRGAERVHHWEVLPWGDEGTETGGIIITSEEITAERHAQETLRRSEERFRTLAENIPEHIWTADSTGHLEYLSRSWSEYAGENLQCNTVLDFSRIVHPEHVRPMMDAMRHSLRTGSSFEREIPLRNAAGDYEWHLARAVRLPDGRWFGTTMNIEQMKRTHEALIRSEKLASAGRLAATIAHEVNNPLEAAISAIYLASAEPMLPPAARTYLRVAQEELRRAGDIVRHTLGFIRETKASGPVDLEETVDSVLKLVESRITDRGIVVMKKFRPTPRTRVVASELRQLLANLISNAIDAMPTGGRLHVRTGFVNGKVAVVIADTGVGVRPENRRRLFEPFFTTKEMIGTGLGLWLAKEIAINSGGNIRVHSKVGKGTVFTVFLPAFDPSSDPTPE